MKPAIQRFPAALLPLLSIKAGDTPPVLDEIVGPGLEMLPFYVADRLETSVASSLALSAVGSILIPVPSGEYWWLYAVNAVASNITAASSVMLGCGVQTPEGNAIYLGSMDAPTVSVAGQAFAVPGPVPGPGLLLRPGCNLFAQTLVDPGAGTLDLFVRGFFARLSPT